MYCKDGIDQRGFEKNEKPVGTGSSKASRQLAKGNDNEDYIAAHEK